MKMRYVWSWRLLGWIEMTPGRAKAILRVWYYDRANHLWGYRPYWHACQMHSLLSTGAPY